MAATDQLRATRRRMRIMLSALLAGALCSAAQGQDRGAASLWVYQSDDQLTVIHPAATVQAKLTQDTGVSVGYDADIISAATIDVRAQWVRNPPGADEPDVDVVTGASPWGFEETRHGLSLGVDHAFGRRVETNLGYRFSHTPDYITHAGSLGMAVQDEGKNHVVSVALSGAHGAVGRVGDLRPVGTVYSLGATLSYAGLLSESLVGDVGLALEYQSGYLESPYRTIPVYAPGNTSDPREHYPESVPDARTRAALHGRLRYAFTPILFGRGEVRLHADDWGIVGATTALGMSVEPHPDWLIGLTGRLYLQQAARFYRGRYQTYPRVPTHITGDRELAGGNQVGVGTRFEYVLPEWLGFTWRTNLSGDLTWRHYDDTPKLPKVFAMQVGFALVAER